MSFRKMLLKIWWFYPPWIRIRITNQGPASGSIWTFLGSWIRIRIKTYADPKHWYSLLGYDGNHRRRMQTEQKAKVVAVVWATYLNAALTIQQQRWFEKKKFFGEHPLRQVGGLVWCKPGYHPNYSENCGIRPKTLTLFSKCNFQQAAMPGLYCRLTWTPHNFPVGSLLSSPSSNPFTKWSGCCLACSLPQYFQKFNKRALVEPLL